MEINAITETIIGCAYTVANTLGCGFLEKVYENALVHELKKAGLEAVAQYPIRVVYDNVPVGHFLADICVAQRILVEIKAAKELHPIHLAQCLNYLKATGMQICLLINFGTPRIQIKRVAL